MAKIMIVEDDRNLQTIYGDRLTAEGHTIITASDGEEALAVAVKEKPDLIISDIMMPKISGFDMLDILRSTPETKNVKIIMMTALSQAEDRERADKLGADKYLVKSQVTLDDVASTVNEIVQGLPGSTTAAAAAPASDSPPPATPSNNPATEPVTPPVEPAKIAVSTDPAASTDIAADEQAKISSQIDDFLNKNTPVAAPTPTPAETYDEAVAFHPPIELNGQGSQKVVMPIIDVDAPKKNIFDLYEKELAKEAEAEAKAPEVPPSEN